MNNRVTIESSCYPRAETTIRLPEREYDAGITPLCIDTGAASLQTYATRDELRALGEMLIRHASAGEVLDVTT